MEDNEIRQRFEHTWRLGRQKFLASASRVAGSVGEADDILQDVVLRALGNLGALANVQNLTAWIYAAIRNRVIDLWRRGKTRRDSGEIDLGEALIEEIVAGTGLDPLDEFVRDEINDALATAIGLLPPEQREVIEAQVFGGISFRELAEQTGVSIDTLAARKRYAIKTLQGALRDWIEEN